MKTYIQYIIAIAFITLYTKAMIAQDIHFSQFYSSPLTLNPATTGNFAGDYRVSSIYRNQWRTVGDVDKPAYRTFNLGFDMPLYLGDHKLGVGLMAYQDKAGPADLNAINTLKITGSLSYVKNISNHKIAIAFQPAYTQKSTGDVSQLKNTQDSIFDSGLKPGTGPVDNIAANQAIKYLDLNAGVMWTKKFGKFEPVAGFGLFHIIKPKESLIEDETNRLPNRPVFSFGGTYDFSEKIFFMPNILYMSHKKVKDMMYGLNVGYRLPAIDVINYIYAGPQFRQSPENFDAFILTVGVNLPKWNIGIARDMTGSALRKGTQMQGAWEVSVIYIAPETLLKKKTIPCERL